jgi:16S rRNA (cytosine967-C5)-methyltransferase
MEQSFLDRHIQTFFKIFFEGKKPLDLTLSHYFKDHKNLGSKDRKMIGNTIYGMMRWKTLIDHFSPQNPIEFFRHIHWEKIAKDPSIPQEKKLGLPRFIFERFSAQFGDQLTLLLGEILNQEAPTTVRVNLAKTTREKMLSLWADRFSVSPCVHSLSGIKFHKREPLFSLPEFKEGLFEIQDEGSQLISDLIDIKPGESVLDYCSGSGGKTLGFAHKMNGKGQIYLHDIRVSALNEARIRLRRAGVQNAQFLEPNHPQLKKILKKCDWVLIDVPCSGTGTLRRNPDQKWKIDASMVEKLISEQKAIILEAFKYLKPGGTLVYATCSLLQEENQDAVKYILNSLSLKLKKDPLFLLPQPGGMDGFFCAVFRN